jgi:predicted MPP superfamily phosphohydrolase
MKLKLVIVLIAVFSINYTFSQKNNQLNFHPDGTFKIAQFTDIHWDENSENSVKTLKIIQNVLTTENPDFAVITGDIITTNPTKKGWKAIAEPFIDSETPWTVTLGNHDSEADISRHEIFEILNELPYFIGEEGNVSGVGNFVVPILNHKENKNATLLFFLDSKDYAVNQEISHYDWMKFDQIKWFREKSDYYAELNNNTPVPSLAFFHIPLPEYEFIADDATTIGDQFEGIASSEINSGLFASMIDKDNIMGVFAGHDHDNNYIGIYKNIALGFGQVTGLDAYGQLDRGARIIILHENKTQFETYIRNEKEKKFHYHYPSGVPEPDSTTIFFKSTDVKNLKQGIHYKYYEGNVQSVQEISSLKVKKSGIMPNISIDSAQVEDYFAFKYEGWLNIEEEEYYRFYLTSDDGAVLWIDGQKIIDNDGTHSAHRKEAIVPLEAGLHRLKIEYFESYMGQQLEVGFSSPHNKSREIPNELLYFEK